MEAPAFSFSGFGFMGVRRVAYLDALFVEDEAVDFVSDFGREAEEGEEVELRSVLLRPLAGLLISHGHGVDILHCLFRS